MKKFSSFLLILTLIISGSSIKGYCQHSPTTQYTQFKTSLIAYTPTGLSLADGNTTVYDSTFSNNTDNDDVIKIKNFGENCGLYRNDDTLAIEARKTFVSKDSIFYRMWNLKQQQYRLQFVPKNMNIPGLTAMLEDNFLATITPVSIVDTTSVDFFVTANVASSASNRFRVVFKISSVMPLTFTNIKAVELNGRVNVEWDVANETNIDRFFIEHSADGRNFENIGTIKSKGNSIVHKYVFTDTKPFDGNNFYKIKAVEFSGRNFYSQIGKVSLNEKNIKFSIGSNPVLNNSLNLQLYNQPYGKYLVRLINISGQLIVNKTIENLERSYRKTINLPSNLKSGAYQLEVFWPNGTDKEVQKIIINNN